MAASSFPTKQCTAEQFVESAGAVLFDESMSRVCLIHFIQYDEWLLAKGRRNCGESRHDAALREVREETGYACRLLPLTMSTRAPPAVETVHTPDVPRTYEKLVEPFMVTVRELDNGTEMKIIWWYVAVTEKGQDGDRSLAKGEDQFEAKFLDFADALSKLTFQGDRDVLETAVSLVHANVKGR
ncbi:hypothetical protein SLS56_007681 [Neofusicoccum ribis]|uniref:Nudix hydrolase domain-containing protein n=1 Tax=Neofusicoccum ribis TaxID=45134 RepID=A0ABR3SNS4_9PEZI